MFIRRYIYLPLFLCEDSELDGLRIWADWIPLDSMECERMWRAPVESRGGAVKKEELLL